MSPKLGSALFVRYAVCLLNFMGLLLLLASPAVVGGMVQFMKLTGRWIIGQQLQNRLKEALRRMKRRGEEPPSAEMLLANMEEEYNDEIGFITTDLA